MEIVKRKHALIITLVIYDTANIFLMNRSFIVRLGMVFQKMYSSKLFPHIVIRIFIRAAQLIPRYLEPTIVKLYDRPDVLELYSQTQQGLQWS